MTTAYSGKLIAKQHHTALMERIIAQHRRLAILDGSDESPDQTDISPIFIATEPSAPHGAFPKAILDAIGYAQGSPVGLGMDNNHGDYTAQSGLANITISTAWGMAYGASNPGSSEAYTPPDADAPPKQVGTHLLLDDSYSMEINLGSVIGVPDISIPDPWIGFTSKAYATFSNDVIVTLHLKTYVEDEYSQPSSYDLTARTREDIDDPVEVEISKTTNENYSFKKTSRAEWSTSFIQLEKGVRTQIIGIDSASCNNGTLNITSHFLEDGQHLRITCTVDKSIVNGGGFLIINESGTHYSAITDGSAVGTLQFTIDIVLCNSYGSDGALYFDGLVVNGNMYIGSLYGGVSGVSFPNYCYVIGAGQVAGYLELSKTMTIPRFRTKSLYEKAPTDSITTKDTDNQVSDDEYEVYANEYLETLIADPGWSFDNIQTPLTYDLSRHMLITNDAGVPITLDPWGNAIYQREDYQYISAIRTADLIMQMRSCCEYLISLGLILGGDVLTSPTWTRSIVKKGDPEYDCDIADIDNQITLIEQSERA